MNRYFFCLFILCLISCQDKYDGEKRILLDLHVTDKQGNSLSEKHIEILADDAIEYVFNDADIISYGTTDANGMVRLVFPVRENYASVYTLRFEGDDEFPETAFTQIEEVECVNYKVPITQLTLLKAEEVISLFIDPISVSGQELIWVTIDGPHAGNLPYGIPDITSNSNYYSNFQVAKNSSVVIRFATQMNGVITQHEQIVEIGSEELVYNLNY